MSHTIEPGPLLTPQDAMNGDPLQRTVRIINPQGFHMRPIAAFVQQAIRYQCDVKVSYGGQSVNGKSILDLMQLGAAQGAELTLEATGADAEPALDALVKVLNTPMSEDS